MFSLAPKVLDQALHALDHHVYGDFFPEPPELELIRNNWNNVLPELASLDLDIYAGYESVASFAPKSRLNVRRVALLHFYDLLIYTALVLEVRSGVTSARLPRAENRVFSYRADSAPDGVLYDSAPGYPEFKAAIEARSKSNPTSYLGITDIADFYPRVYQHRLVNALQAACGPSKYDQIRVLEKMLYRFADGASYGIPVGPAASRVLGEAVLIDVDSTLLSNSVDFVRFTDDYVIFSLDPEGAEYGVRVLGETLFLNHGLTLQTAKTRVLPVTEYVHRYLEAHEAKEVQRRELIEIVGHYDQRLSYDKLSKEQRAKVDAMNLSEMLKDALEQGHNVDFKEVSFILGRLSALQKPELIPIVLNNLERLSPVAHSIAAFFRGFNSLDKKTRDKIATTLLGGVGDRKFPEYYSVWVLYLFAQSREWNHADSLLRIFRQTHSDVIRRYAALALRMCGTRAEAIEASRYLSAASSLSRTAILLATARMGSDERKYLKKALRLTDSLELLCATAL